MKYIKILVVLVAILSSCKPKMDVNDPYQMKPPYKLINLFARKIMPQTGLVLVSFGYNNYLPRGYQLKNGIGHFSASFSLQKRRSDEISLEYARNLIVFLGENLLQDINSNLEIRDELDFYPFPNDMINLTVRFKDENQIELGQGVAIVYFSKGKIEYEGYKIEKYTGRYPAEGKHYTILQESYEEALEIVKKQGNLKYIE